MPNLPRLPKRKRERSNRKSPTASVYQNNRWHKVSRMHRIKNPICPVCEEMGEATDITPGGRKGSTDHVIRISKGGSVFDEHNLMGLCRYHHDVKSWMESQSMMDWLAGKRNHCGYLIPTTTEREKVIAMIAKHHFNKQANSNKHY